MTLTDTGTAPRTAADLVDGGPELLHSAATAATRPLATDGPLEPAQPQPVTGNAEDLVGAGAQALTIDVDGTARGTVTLVVASDRAEALRDGPLGAADLTAALSDPITDAVAELEEAFGAPLQLGVADAVEAAALHLGPEAVAVRLTDAGTPVAALVVELTATSAGPEAADEPATFTPFVEDAGSETAQRSLELLHDVEMAVTVELGRTRMAVSDLLSLAPGTVVELDRAAGSPVDVLVNGKLIARGEVVVVDEDFAIRVSEIVGLRQSRG